MFSPLNQRLSALENCIEYAVLRFFGPYHPISPSRSRQGKGGIADGGSRRNRNPWFHVTYLCNQNHKSTKG